ncbi:MAG: hypothetical protein AAF384_13905 [Pseudomonadota bacterium]
MAFRFVLWAIGALLWVASRTNRRIQSQLARDLDLVIKSEDGVARTYRVRSRRLNSSAGEIEKPLLRVRFATASHGFKTFVAPNAIDHILDGLGSGDIICEGQAAIVLWFYEMAIGLLPWNRTKRDRWPDCYEKPNESHKVSHQITREGIVDELDPSWQGAHAQREKTMIWAVGRGGEPEGVVRKHKIVLDLKPVEEPVHE